MMETLSKTRDEGSWIKEKDGEDQEKVIRNIFIESEDLNTELSAAPTSAKS